MNTMYAEVKNNKFVKIVKRPKWLNDNGIPLSDQELLKFGIFPIKDEPLKNVDYFSKTVEKNDYDKWEVRNNEVIITYSLKDKDFDNEKENIRKRIKQTRKNYEYGGMLFVDSNKEILKISTTINSQSKLINLKSLVTKNNQNDKILFKTKEGFKEITYSDIVRLSEKINKFVQDCFKRENELEKLLDECKTFVELKKFSENFKQPWSKDSLYDENFLYKGIK